MTPRNQGPVEILCKEVGAVFTQKMESVEVLVAFIGVLVNEISEMMAFARLTGQGLSIGTVNALDHVKSLVTISDRDELIKATDSLFISKYGPGDHYIDMLASCVSVIKFGLEIPCRSRHAAEAANHIWKHKYGINLFDRYTSVWGKEWARDKFYEALGNDR